MTMMGIPNASVVWNKDTYCGWYEWIDKNECIYWSRAEDEHVRTFRRSRLEPLASYCRGGGDVTSRSSGVEPLKGLKESPNFLKKLHGTTQTLTTHAHSPLWTHAYKPYPYKHLRGPERQILEKLMKSPYVSHRRWVRRLPLKAQCR